MEIRENLFLIGPNRRSDQTHIELHLLLSATELAAFEAGWTGLIDAFRGELAAVDIPVEAFQPLIHNPPEEILAAFAQLLTTAALTFQQSAGHRVSQQGFALDTAGEGVWVWYEFEHDEAGEGAAELTWCLLAQLEPAFTWRPEGKDTAGTFAEQVPRYLASAREKVLPIDAEAIMAAAERLDVPCFKLDRDPYKGVTGDFRVRPHGLLKLGHCKHQQILDGTLCITRNAEQVPMFHDREALRQQLQALGVPLAASDPASARLLVTIKAIRAAQRIGYPVVIRPASRSHRKGLSLNVNDEAGVRLAMERARRISDHVLIERMLPGTSHQVLWVNLHIVAVIHLGVAMPATVLHPSTEQLVRRLAEHFDTGALLVDIVCNEIGQPLEPGSGAVVDVDIAPRLDTVLAQQPELLQQAAEALVRWLYPPGANARIPIVAVTGTNGKTTTCRMISRIMMASEHCVGLVCSGGVHVDEQFRQRRWDIGQGEHHRVLEFPEVDFAVLEEYFGKIAGAGFSYSWCDVAVCTNITEDHLGRKGVHTVQQVADLKVAVVERARYGAVLSADDPLCLAMAEQVAAHTICLVSRHYSAQQLLARVAGKVRQKLICCVVECVEGEDWLVVVAEGHRTPITRVNDIPSTFAGAAGHNISNALHAAGASFLCGADPQGIRDGLVSLTMDGDNTPGRLNFYEHYPFRILVDYAHNIDGYRQLVAFIGRITVSGRKIVMANIAGDRRDGDIIHTIGALAGHFDHYVCRNYKDLRGRPPEAVPALMKSGLMKAGVAESAISVACDSYQGLARALSMAAAGDLLVLLAGEAEIGPLHRLLSSGDLENIQSGAPALQ